MSNQIIWEDKGVLTRYKGVFSTEEHEEGLNKLFGDARMDDIKYIIGDYSQVNGKLLSEDNVEYPLAMTIGAATYLKNVKVALIATDKKIIELCKLFIVLSNDINPTWEPRLFKDINAAREWSTSIILEE